MLVGPYPLYLVSHPPAVVTEDVAAITTKQLIKLIFLRSGKSRLYQPGGDSDGVGRVVGRQDLGLLAWTERCVRPRVFVYQVQPVPPHLHHQYNNPAELRVLAPRALLEYRSLAFRCLTTSAGKLPCFSIGPLMSPHPTNPLQP